MKKPLLHLIVGATMALICAGVSADEHSQDPAERIATERAQIEAQRSTQEAQFEREHADCYQRFAVTDCQREVRWRKRQALDLLRRRELLLNEAQRQLKARESQQRLQEKS
jgi:hypothetical protein